METFRVGLQVRLPFGVNDSITAAQNEALIAYASGVAEGLFVRDVENKISMDTYKGASKTPVPLSNEDLQAGVDLARRSLQEPSARPSSTRGWERARWSPAQCVAEFVLCILDMWTQETMR